MTTELTTTFALIREHGACTEGYAKLARALGGVRAYGQNTPIPIARIIDTNNLSDALWSLRAVPPDQAADRDRIARLFACDCAERVLPLYEAKHPDDPRPRNAIAVARRYAMGEATSMELAAARAAARAAAGDAARDAAWDAAWDAARDAAWDAAWDAEQTWQADHLRAMLTAAQREEVTA